jgi:2-keto-4-pentenoate hydratase/2-oxohepta-3-ene-1,7-dioic acid hydratase in catechol pathway
MRLATIRATGQPGGVEEAAVVTGRGVVPIRFINAQRGKAWPTDLFQLIDQGLNEVLEQDAERTPRVLDPSQVSFAPLYRHPRKIWGIGLNYREHAQDLGASFPTEPASFMKADHTIIGPGDYIQLPSQPERVTAEAELGVVIGKTCRDVSVEEAMSYVAGVCLILDMTAEDMVVKNPRYLTRAKNFDTFFSFGPELITLDEVPDLLGLTVGTYKNGSLWRENVVANMAFPPDYLVSFHSHVAPLFPGDIISTGTPGAVVIEEGDVAECRIDGLGSLANPVRGKARNGHRVTAGGQAGMTARPTHHN